MKPIEKPFVVCHMFTSIEGKIDGAFMSNENALPARAVYGKLRGFYESDATIYGTVTMRGFADGVLDEAPHSDKHYPREDWAAPHDVGQFIVAVDSAGILAWDSPYLERPGRPRAHIIEALTDRTSDDYVSYLRETGVSYAFAGKEHADCALLLEKLGKLFGIQRIILAGGGLINGAFLRQGQIDEISLVISPVADGNTTANTTFETEATQTMSTAFRLKAVEQVDGDGLWIRYSKK